MKISLPALSSSLVFVFVATAGCGEDPRKVNDDSQLDDDDDIGDDDDDDDDDDDGDDDDNGDDDDDNGNAPLFLLIEPPEVVQELDLGETVNVPFTVTAVYEDVSRNITGDAEWTISNPALGSVDVATSTLTVPAFDTNTVGSAILTATFDGAEGKAQLTVAAYKQTGPNHDFFFVLPFEEPEQAKELTFSTDVKSMDVFVDMDTTGSMGPPIANLQAALASDIIPQAKSQIADTQFGAGYFEDFPVGSYGAVNNAKTGTDQPFVLSQAISSDAEAVSDAVYALTDGSGKPIGNGFDFPESLIESLYQIATGNGLDGPGDTLVAANHTGIGGVGFREGTMPVIVTITDAVSHAPGEPDCDFNGSRVNIDYDDPSISEAATRDEAKDALLDICARVVGIAVNSEETCSALSDITDFAVATGARVPPAIWDESGNRPAGCGADECCTGANGTGVDTDDDGMCPLVYRVGEDGSGVDAGVVEGLAMLTRYAPFQVTRNVLGEDQSVDGNPLPDGRTSLDFIKGVVPTAFGEPPLDSAPDPTMTDETFENVTPGTAVTFEISAVNDFLYIEPGQAARVFVAHIDVSAGECADLDARDVYIMVPPDKLPPPG